MRLWSSFSSVVHAHGPCRRAALAALAAGVREGVAVLGAGWLRECAAVHVCTMDAPTAAVCAPSIRQQSDAQAVGARVRGELGQACADSAESELTVAAPLAVLTAIHICVRYQNNSLHSLAFDPHHLALHSTVARTDQTRPARPLPRCRPAAAAAPSANTPLCPVRVRVDRAHSRRNWRAKQQSDRQQTVVRDDPAVRRPPRSSS